MEAALWTVFLVVLPGIWWFASGEALTWFTEGEPPRLLRPLVRRLRPPAERGIGEASSITSTRWGPRSP